MVHEWCLVCKGKLVPCSCSDNLAFLPLHLFGQVLLVSVRFSVLHTLVMAFVPYTMNYDQLSVAPVMGCGMRWIRKATGVPPLSSAYALLIVGTCRIARALGCRILHGYVVSWLLFVPSA